MFTKTQGFNIVLNMEIILKNNVFYQFDLLYFICSMTRKRTAYSLFNKLFE